MRKISIAGALGLGSLSVSLFVNCTASNGPEGPEHTGRATTALGGDTTVLFTVALPVGSPPPAVVAAAARALRLDDGVTLVDPTGHSVIASGGTLALGVSTVAGDKPSHTVVDVISTGSVFLSNNAEITGFLQTSSQPTEQAGAVVDGSVLIQPTFTTNESWSVTFPAATSGDVSLEPGTARSITPGAYANVSVKSRSTLTLAAGTYTFSSLDLEPQATIVCNTSSAPLVIYVQNSLLLNGGSISTSGGAATLLLGYAGTSGVSVGAPFSGTLVAPSAAVTLAALNAPQSHTGAFFGQSVEVSPRSRVVHAAFGSWFSAIPLAGPTVQSAVQFTGPVPAPPLQGPADVPAFLQWAYGSRPSQVNAARAAIAGVAGNEAVAAAIVNIVSNDDDLGRNLVGISMLGELRTQTGFQYFTSLVTTPLPTTGTLIAEPGQTQASPREAVNLSKLQARAIDGLALLMSSAADAVILNAITSTTSNVVRARAVHDYLFVHGDAGRATVAPLLSADQQILLDRFDVPGPTPYNTRLATFLAKHPEVVPPPLPIANDQ